MASPPFYKLRTAEHLPRGEEEYQGLLHEYKVLTSNALFGFLLLMQEKKAAFEECLLWIGKNRLQLSSLWYYVLASN